MGARVCADPDTGTRKLSSGHSSARGNCPTGLSQWARRPGSALPLAARTRPPGHPKRLESGDDGGQAGRRRPWAPDPTVCTQDARGRLKASRAAVAQGWPVSSQDGPAVPPFPPGSRDTLSPLVATRPDMLVSGPPPSSVHRLTMEAQAGSRTFRKPQRCRALADSPAVWLPSCSRMFLGPPAGPAPAGPTFSAQSHTAS